MLVFAVSFSWSTRTLIQGLSYPPDKRQNLQWIRIQVKLFNRWPRHRQSGDTGKIVFVIELDSLFEAPQGASPICNWNKRSRVEFQLKYFSTPLYAPALDQITANTKRHIIWVHYQAWKNSL